MIAFATNTFTWRTHYRLSRSSLGTMAHRRSLSFLGIKCSPFVVPSVLPAVDLFLDEDRLLDNLRRLVNVDDLVMHNGFRVMFDDGKWQDERNHRVLEDLLHRSLHYEFCEHMSMCWALVHKAQKDSGSDHSNAEKTHDDSSWGESRGHNEITNKKSTRQTHLTRTRQHTIFALV